MSLQQPIQCIVQHPEALILGVAYGAFPPDTYISLKHAVVLLDNWRFEFHIIGESHLVRIEHEGGLIQQEILACTDLDPRRCQHYHPFVDLASHDYRHRGYAVAIDFAREPGSIDLPVDPSAMLEVVFPEVYGFSPYTQLYWHLDGRIVRWATLHTYPDSHGVTYVRSASQFYCASTTQGSYR